MIGPLNLVCACNSQFDEYNFLMDVVAECVSALPARQQQLQQRFQQQMAALSAATSLLPQQQTDGKESKAAGSGGAASSSLMNSAGAAPSLPAAAAVAAAAPSYAAAAAAASGLPAVVVYTDANREASRKFAKRFWRLSRGFVRLGAQAELAAAAVSADLSGVALCELVSSFVLRCMGCAGERHRGWDFGYDFATQALRSLRVSPLSCPCRSFLQCCSSCLLP